MPPWKAEPGFGEFANDRHLTPEQIALFKDWAAAGAPEGNTADLPPAPKFTEGWTLGEPDVVLEPDEDYELSAEGPDIYRCFVIPTKFTEDHFIRALEVQPGNRKVVHHVIVHFDTTGRAREIGCAPTPARAIRRSAASGFRSGGMIGGWAPGNFPSLSAGWHRTHWCRKGPTWWCRCIITDRANRKPTARKSRCILRTGPWTRESARFPWPSCCCASRRGTPITSSMPRLPVRLDATLYRVTPHMHLLGREMKVTATLPDGTLMPLVHVDNWDFNWQTGYEFKTPLHLPAGSRVDLEAHYDNSSGNPLNPNNPPKLVTWGEQTTDEMCLAFLSFTLDSEHLAQGIAVRGYDLNERRERRTDTAQ